MRREWRECFPRHRLQMKPLVSDTGLHHDTCVTHVPWCMSGLLTRGGRRKRSRHSRRMRNPQFYVSVKRPIEDRAWITNHIPYVYAAVVTHPYPNCIWSGNECGPLPMPSLIAWSSQAKHESVYEKDGRKAVALRGVEIAGQKYKKILDPDNCASHLLINTSLLPFPTELEN